MLVFESAVVTSFELVLELEFLTVFKSETVESAELVILALFKTTEFAVEVTPVELVDTTSLLPEVVAVESAACTFASLNPIPKLNVSNEIAAKSHPLLVLYIL